MSQITDEQWEWLMAAPERIYDNKSNHKFEFFQHSTSYGKVAITFHADVYGQFKSYLLHRDHILTTLCTKLLREAWDIWKLQKRNNEL